MGDTLPTRPVTLRASTVARVHTILAYTAFLTAFCIGCLLHYKKIVNNGVAGYPEEWFPSVSATIGDWYPERNIFQILIALTSGPRFALVYLQYYLQSHRTQPLSSKESSNVAGSRFGAWPGFLFAVGIVRTLSCGGWVYITSTDDHDVHDVCMILYIVCNLPWMVGGVKCSNSRGVRRRRTFIASAFFLAIIPLVYFFIQHKVHRIPGAYTHYAFFEWGLIFFDVTYDAISEQEFGEADLKITIGSGQSTDAITPIKDDRVSKNNTNGVSSTTVSAQIATPTSSESRVSFSPCPPVSRSCISFLSDVYLSYISLTIFTALIPTLFYFSIWELGIAGQELALLAVLSPFFFGFSAIRTFAQRRVGQIILRTLSLSGLLAYLLRTPLERLVVVTPAVALSVLADGALWLAGDAEYQATVYGLGWIATSVVKHGNHTNNPLWPFINAKSGGYNKTGLILALLSLVEISTRPLHSPTESAARTQPRVPSPHWLTAALPLGSFLFSIHSLLAESSTLVAWSWTGYENGVPRGPLPHIHDSLTIIVQCLGLAFALWGCMTSSGLSTELEAREKNEKEKYVFGSVVQLDCGFVQVVIRSPFFFVFGALSTYALYAYKDWPGYIGGLGVAFFLMALTPSIFHQVGAVTSTTDNPEKRVKVGRTLGVAFVVYCLFILASIFTVAYAFVPGGVHFRERTNLVLTAQLAFLLPLFLSSRLHHRRLPQRKSSGLHDRSTYCILLLSLFAILSGLTTIYRLPRIPPKPFKPGPRIVQAGIWTVHFGFDNEGHDSQRGIRNLLRDMQLDVVGLLETDLHRTAFGHRDLTRVIVEDLGYNVDIGPGPNQHTWGCVLLSKFPIINSTHHLLPSPDGELAPAIEAVLDVYGTEITVIVSHNGQEETPLDRELQSKELARIMAKTYPKPVIFLGYVVTQPHATRPNPYEIMVTDGRVHDIDQDDYDRWCEYIFYRGLYRTAYARISRGIITDTEMQIGQFVVPRHGTTVSDDSLPARYARANKEEMPEQHWFPNEYYGGPGQGGVDGHYYHVFNTPLYYMLP